MEKISKLSSKSLVEIAYSVQTVCKHFYVVFYAIVRLIDRLGLIFKNCSIKIFDRLKLENLRLLNVTSLCISGEV